MRLQVICKSVVRLVVLLCFSFRGVTGFRKIKQFTGSACAELADGRFRCLCTPWMFRRSIYWSEVFFVRGVHWRSLRNCGGVADVSAGEQEMDVQVTVSTCCI